MGFLTVVNVGILIMDGHLVYFHLWIQSKGITTFDYIMFKREMKERLGLLKDGSLTREEYDKWRKEASPDKTMKKSKIILKVSDFDKKNEDKDLSQIQMHGKTQDFTDRPTLRQNSNTGYYIEYSLRSQQQGRQEFI